MCDLQSEADIRLSIYDCYVYLTFFKNVRVFID